MATLLRCVFGRLFFVSSPRSGEDNASSILDRLVPHNLCTSKMNFILQKTDQKLEKNIVNQSRDD